MKNILIALFFGLALAGGLLEWVHPKAQPIKGPNIEAVKAYVVRMGYQPGFYKQVGLENYLSSRMDGLNYHKRMGEWIWEIHFSRDQTLDITFLNPADPYPLFSVISRELNQQRTCEALIILRTNQELKRLVDLATGGRILLSEVIKRQEMKLKAIEEGKDDLESWEFTSGSSCYVRVSSGKRPLAIGIGY